MANSQTTKGRLSEVCPNNLHSRVIQSSGNTGVNPHDLEGDNSFGGCFFVWLVLFYFRYQKWEGGKHYISWTLSIFKISQLTLRDSSRTSSEGHCCSCTELLSVSMQWNLVWKGILNLSQKFLTLVSKDIKKSQKAARWIEEKYQVILNQIKDCNLTTSRAAMSHLLRSIIGPESSSAGKGACPARQPAFSPCNPHGGRDQRHALWHAYLSTPTTHVKERFFLRPQEIYLKDNPNGKQAKEVTWSSNSFHRYTSKRNKNMSDKNRGEAYGKCS